jgi:hypothetical protein
MRSQSLMSIIMCVQIVLNTVTSIAALGAFLVLVAASFKVDERSGYVIATITAVYGVALAALHIYLVVAFTKEVRAAHAREIREAYQFPEAYGDLRDFPDERASR